jgi:flagellar basal-body rod modification protein FlgD
MTVSSTYPTSIDAANASATGKGNNVAASTAPNTLAKLAGNFNDFLSLLTTQLKNQDPTSPMDTNQFTSQLVQFTSVSEQISTNATLGQLLTASLAQQLGQASNLVGTQVSFSGGTLPLQGGTARVDFQSGGAQPVQISVYDSNGSAVHTETVNATDGSNTWSWNGKGPNGVKMPDGAYSVAVTAAGTNLNFQAVGTVTGAEQANQAIQLKFGLASIGYDKVVSLGAPHG